MLLHGLVLFFNGVQSVTSITFKQHLTKNPKIITELVLKALNVTKMFL